MTVSNRKQFLQNRKFFSIITNGRRIFLGKLQWIGYIFRLRDYADGVGKAALAVTDANTPSAAVGITAPALLHCTEK